MKPAVPMTSDGVPFVRGMTVWDWEGNEQATEGEDVDIRYNPVTGWLIDYGACGRLNISASFSTPEAAKAHRRMRLAQKIRELQNKMLTGNY